MLDSLILPRICAYPSSSSGVNIKYLFHFLTDHMLFSNHRQQFGQALWETVPQIDGGGNHGFTEKRSNLVLDMEFIVYCILLTHVRVIHSDPVGSVVNKRLTVKLFTENFPQKSSARFRYCSIVPFCRAVKPSYNYSSFFQCVPAENRSQ